MKKSIIVLCALLVGITLFAQPEEWQNFPPQPAPNQNGSFQGSVTLDGETAANGDFIAAFSPEGNLVGVSQVFTSGDIAFFSILIYQSDPNNPGLISSGENFTLQLYTTADDQFHVFGAPDEIGPFTSNNGGVIEGLSNVTTGEALDNGFTTNPLDFVTSALPVELAAFDLESNECGQYKLKWTTHSELNNDFFTIERSIGSLDRFEKIATIDSKGNSDLIQNYKYTDRLSLNAAYEVYYRLSQTDLDGKTEVFNILHVRHQCIEEVAIGVYPNPVSDKLNINVPNTDEVSIKAFNAMGVEMLNMDMDESSVIGVQDWPEGVYVLNIYQYDQLIESRKIVKE